MAKKRFTKCPEPIVIRNMFCLVSYVEIVNCGPAPTQKGLYSEL